MDEDGLSFHIHPHGSGSLKYGQLRIVQSVHTQGFRALHLAYRTPDVSRIRMPGRPLKDKQKESAKLIQAHYGAGQLYRV